MLRPRSSETQRTRPPCGPDPAWLCYTASLAYFLRESILISKDSPGWIAAGIRRASQTSLTPSLVVSPESGPATALSTTLRLSKACSLPRNARQRARAAGPERHRVPRAWRSPGERPRGRPESPGARAKVADPLRRPNPLLLRRLAPVRMPVDSGTDSLRRFRHRLCRFRGAINIDLSRLDRAKQPGVPGLCSAIPDGSSIQVFRRRHPRCPIRQK